MVWFGAQLQERCGAAGSGDSVSAETADAGQADYFALLILVAAGAWRRQSV